MPLKSILTRRDTLHTPHVLIDLDPINPIPIEIRIISPPMLQVRGRTAVFMHSGSGVGFGSDQVLSGSE